MADEIEVAITQISYNRENYTTYDIGRGVTSYQLDASGTQDDGAAYSGNVEATATITNNHNAKIRVAIWETVGTVGATNSFPINAGDTVDTKIYPNQKVSVRVV